MPGDLYGRNGQPFGGALAADSAIMTFAYNDFFNFKQSSGMLIQQMQINYQQPVNRIYELSSSYVYYVAGRPRGEGQLGTVVGPVGLAGEFMRTYGNVCNSATNALFIYFKPGCGAADINEFGGVQISATTQIVEISGVILVNVGIQVRAEDMMFNQAVSFIFASMVTY